MSLRTPSAAAVRARGPRPCHAQHPHICAIYDVGRHDNVDCLVMELLDGTTLAARVSLGPLDTTEAVRLATQIADALDRAHDHGMFIAGEAPQISPDGASLSLSLDLAVSEYQNRVD